jgi:fumarylacetoacetase
MYWTFAQVLGTTHPTDNLHPGDLIASGTVSGEPRFGRLPPERTWRGTEPLSLPSGESRRFLETGILW